jgi:hypothetical protein
MKGEMKPSQELNHEETCRAWSQALAEYKLELLSKRKDL